MNEVKRTEPGSDESIELPNISSAFAFGANYSSAEPSISSEAPGETRNQVITGPFLRR